MADAPVTGWDMGKGYNIGQVLRELEQFRRAILAYHQDSFLPGVQKGNPFVGKHKREVGSVIMALRTQVSEYVKAVNARPKVSIGGSSLCRDDAGFVESFAHIMSIGYADGSFTAEPRPFDMVMNADNLPAGAEYPKWLLELTEDTIWKYCKVATHSARGWWYLLRRRRYSWLFVVMGVRWVAGKIRRFRTQWHTEKQQFWEYIRRASLIFAIIGGLAGVVRLVMYILDRSATK